MRLKLLSFITASAVLVAPGIAGAQPATSCVDHAWTQFRTEIESKSNPFEETGAAYLAAYGWISAARTCLAFTSYPASQSQQADEFSARVDSTADAIEAAIRTNSTPTIFGLAQGGSGIFYSYPEDPPAGGPSPRPGTQDRPTPQIGEVLIIPSQQGVLATQGYRMLSLQEWRQIQARLTRMGFDTDGIDGVAGPRTYAAIERYQRSLGLRPTGLLNSQQINELLN